MTSLGVHLSFKSSKLSPTQVATSLTPSRILKNLPASTASSNSSIWSLHFFFASSTHFLMSSMGPATLRFSTTTRLRASIFVGRERRATSAIMTLSSANWHSLSSSTHFLTHLETALKSSISAKIFPFVKSSCHWLTWSAHASWVCSRQALKSSMGPPSVWSLLNLASSTVSISTTITAGFSSNDKHFFTRVCESWIRQLARSKEPWTIPTTEVSLMAFFNASIFLPHAWWISSRQSS
mmetsp:Transcript_55130/g.112779  ORF Transcript_55130/g.112779 Transcript_55130/m.112779 type:complete len:238 (+) Transcript_55130:396-1109(+)